MQVFTDAPGHCSFSVEQWLNTVDAMESWLDTGDRPQDSDFTALGFVFEDIDFVLPEWPQPIP